jgi:hypothetical protein
MQMIVTGIALPPSPAFLTMASVTSSGMVRTQLMDVLVRKLSTGNSCTDTFLVLPLK